MRVSGGNWKSSGEFLATDGGQIERKQRIVGHAAVIIEAPSMLQTRMAAVVRRLAPGVPFGDGVRLTARMMAKIPPERIGRILYGKAATHLILRFRKSRRRVGE
jgi:hypothetical protein